jgi:hypothetical protein
VSQLAAYVQGTDVFLSPNRRLYTMRVQKENEIFKQRAIQHREQTAATERT